jgi:hypothetical protein
MKATLTFDLDTPDGRDDLLTALHGLRYSLALWAVDQYCRKICKYGEPGTVDLEHIRSLIREETEGTPWNDF